MKIAQELRAGTVIKIGSDVLIVQKADYSKSGRNSAVVKLKFKNLLTGASTETVLKASDKVEDIRLEKKKMAFSYADGTSYAFQDQVTWDQVDLTEDDLGDALRYLEENMELEIVFYEGRAVGIELPTSVDREVVYTEPGLRGDTTGRAMKPARLATGFEVMVPLFINLNEIIKIDTRTHEYVERVSK